MAVALFFLALLQDETRPYRLPYEEGTSWVVGQGGMSQGTHKGKWAYDIMMPEGTRVCAARAGRVVWVRQDTPDPPPGKAGSGEANGIRIDHSDGTSVLYIHIKCKSPVVKVGDAVEQGQFICLSGNTGPSPVPHLHLEMQGKDGSTFEPAFEDVDGDGKLAEGKKYTSGNIPGVPVESKNRLSALSRAAKLAEQEGAWGLAYLAWKRFADEKLPVAYPRQEQARAHLREIVTKAQAAEKTYRNRLAFQGVPTKAFDSVRKPDGSADPWENFYLGLKCELEGNLPAARSVYKSILSGKKDDELKKRAESRLAEVRKRLGLR